MIGAVIRALFGGVTTAMGGAKWWVFVVVAGLAATAGGCAGAKLGAVSERAKWAEPFRTIAGDINLARKDAEERATAAAEAAQAAVENLGKAVELAKEKNLRAEQDQQKIINAIWSTRNAIRELENATRDVAVGACSFTPDADRLLKRAHEAVSNAGGSVPTPGPPSDEADRPDGAPRPGASAPHSVRPITREAGGTRGAELPRPLRVSRACFVAEAWSC
jgi:hypothetical protein